MKTQLHPVLLILLMTLTIFISCKEEDTFTDFDRFNQENQAIDEYIDSNNLTRDVDLTYGLRYVLNEEGSGLTAEQWDTIRVSYKVLLFDTEQQVSEELDVKLKLDNQIAGWRILSSKIQEGGSITMFIPSIYAYGTEGSGNIPPNSVLIVELELQEVLHLTEAERFDYEQSRIDAFLESSTDSINIEPTKELRYTILTEGTGASPADDSGINVSLTGYSLNDITFETNVFDEGQGIFGLDELIEGWQILMPYVKEGGEIRMYIPSKYGYGTNSVPIYSNAILIFDVKLNSVL